MMFVPVDPVNTKFFQSTSWMQKFPAPTPGGAAVGVEHRLYVPAASVTVTCGGSPSGPSGCWVCHVFALISALLIAAISAAGSPVGAGTEKLPPVCAALRSAIVIKRTGA